MDMPRRSRSKGRHGEGSRSLSVLNPMKQIRVSASTPPARATDTTPSAIRSAAIASDAAPELQAVTTVSRGPPMPRTLPTTSTCEDGKHDARTRGGAAAAGKTFPVRLDAGAERTDDSEPGDGDGPHAPAVLDAMKRDSVSKEAKWGARSADSSIAIPKRSSIAIDSSMKSRESRPIELSIPLGSVVSGVKSTARRGSNLSRVTRIVLSSSNTSLGSIALLMPVESGAAAAPFARHADRSGGAVLAPERERDQRPAGERLAGARARPGLERRGCPRRIVSRTQVAGYQQGAHRRFDQRAPHEPAPPRVELGAVLEGLDREHERPLAPTALEEPRGLPEPVDRGGRSADQDAIRTGQPELDRHLARHDARRRVRKVRSEEHTSELQSR